MNFQGGELAPIVSNKPSPRLLYLRSARSDQTAREAPRVYEFQLYPTRIVVCAGGSVHQRNSICHHAYGHRHHPRQQFSNH